MTSEAEKRDHRLLVAALGICATGRQTASSGLAKNARDTIKAQDAEIKRLRKELGWQPIETAPKNTQVFCGHDEKKWVRFGICYAEAADRWYYSGTSERSQYSQVEGDAPTHWMPMLTPPRAALGKEG